MNVFSIILEITLKVILYCFLGIAVLGIGFEKKQTEDYNDGCSHLYK
jgi:hypothetical protein